MCKAVRIFTSPSSKLLGGTNEVEVDESDPEEYVVDALGFVQPNYVELEKKEEE